jgi:hypothetical protein
MSEEIEGYALDVDWPEPMVGMPESEFNKYKAVVDALQQQIFMVWACPLCRTVGRDGELPHTPDCPMIPFAEEARS